ncbi:MAG: GAF domain-containing protein [Gemmatimonadaceae bacterium]|nr:GAF domain-containing protein [Gemmatimonadaceae bacterium]
MPALPLASAVDPSRPTVIALDRGLLASAGGDHERLAELAAVAALVGLGDAGELEPGVDFPAELLTSWMPGDAPVAGTITALRGAFRHAASIVAAHHARAESAERAHELSELTAIGAALSTERDLHALLELILTQARRVTGSDAGSIYLVEKDETGAPARLCFAMAQNQSLPALPFSVFTIPIDHTSLAGYAAATREPLVIADVYLLPDDASYQLNRSFDETFGYRTRSTLVLPMTSHRDEIVGVLQLINRKRTPDVRLSSAEVVEREVIGYDDRCVALTSALASQAAVAIENGKLYKDIERLFEGFVTAAVTAIESRDPTTSGHSARVATMTVALAQTVDRAGSGPYRDLSFSRQQLRELRYAGLLHDFGKVGVREQVLVKQKKLYPADLELIRHRFAYLLQQQDLMFERDRADFVLTHGASDYDSARARLDRERQEGRGELERYLDAIVRANEPTVLPEGSFDALHEINRRTFVDFDGRERQLLDDHELQFLMIRKGNLDAEERREIESHVTHTFRFLEQIPWTSELRHIPQIAGAHHEKLNGRGYPHAVLAADIPVQARMMTIADIYDALTATDRPYKRAVATERALDILGMEAREGMLDQALLDAFIADRVYDSLAAEEP